jgi:hypothetical protein
MGKSGKNKRDHPGFVEISSDVIAGICTETEDGPPQVNSPVSWGNSSLRFQLYVFFLQ